MARRCQRPEVIFNQRLRRGEIDIMGQVFQCARPG
jgi:hypothetical protein